MIASLSSTKLFSIGGIVATTTTAGSLGIYFHTGETSAKPVTITDENPEVVEETIEEEVEEAKEDEGFIYVIGTYALLNTHAYDEKNLFKNDQKNFVCKSNEVSIVDKNCAIYKLQDGSSTIEFIDFATRVTSELTVYDHLIANNSYLLKLSKDFYTKNKNKEIHLIDKSSIQVGLGIFKFFDNTGIVEENNKPILESANTFLIKVTENLSSAATINNNDTLTCKMGDSVTEISCMVYKFKNGSGPTNAENISNLNRSIEADDLAVGKYLLIKVNGPAQSLKELENQLVLVQKTSAEAEKTEIVKGYVEQVLIGQLNQWHPTSSRLLVVNGAVNAADQASKSYVITEGNDLHTFLKTDSYAKANYQCRVVVGAEKFDDNACELSTFAENAESYQLDLNTLSEITDHTKFAQGKYQIVKFAKTLHDKLKELTTEKKEIQIIKKDRALAPVNNKLVSLSYISDLASVVSSGNELSSDLLFVKAKTKTGSGTTLNEASNIQCTIDTVAATIIPCKLYKFADTKTDKTIKPSEITSLSESIAVDNEFVVDRYYALELTGLSKKATDLTGKTITLKLEGQSDELAKVDFDQLIFGKAKVIGALAKSNQ